MFDDAGGASSRAIGSGRQSLKHLHLLIAELALAHNFVRNLRQPAISRSQKWRDKLAGGHYLEVIDHY